MKTRVLGIVYVFEIFGDEIFVDLFSQRLPLLGRDYTNGVHHCDCVF